MLEMILFFLAASLVLYAVLGGADFGAGMIELLSPKKHQFYLEQAIYKAMGPVWEANHMWIILAVVILFNGFPGAYAELSILLHLPLTLLLLGIIIRGCAFTFRHYDAFVDGSAKVYSAAFQYSSLFTSLLIGIIIGALTRGEFISADQGSYFEVYWQPWLGLFPLCVVLFSSSLFAYQAAVFLVGEPIGEELKSLCKLLAKRLCLSSVIIGGLVFVTAYIEDIPLLPRMLQHPLSLLAIVVASLLIAVVWFGLNRHKVWLTRLSLAAQMSAILLAWIWTLYPDIIVYADGTSIQLLDTAAPEATLKYLAYALVCGSLLIFPALYYLFRIFKLEQA